MSSEVRIITPSEGQCRDCGRKRQDCYRISRTGGGSYNRPPRSYWTTICAACVLVLFPWAGANPGHSTYSRWDRRRLLDIAASIHASAPVAQPDPGGICDTCGHFAMRHDETGCSGVDPDVGCRFGPGGTKTRPVRCKVFVWTDGVKWWRPSSPTGWVKP